MSNLSAGPVGADDGTAAPEFTPAVSARKSLASKEHIISMIDGKPYKALRRHLTTHGLTPEQYRERYALRPDYPMVAESYAEKRRELAKKLGLGRKPGQKTAGQTPAPPAAKPAKAKAAPKTGAKPARVRAPKAADGAGADG